MSTGSKFTGLHPKQAFIVAGSSIIAGNVAHSLGWQRKFGNALTWQNGEEPIRYIDDAEKLRGYKGNRIYFGPQWQGRRDATLLEELVAEERFLPEFVG